MNDSTTRGELFAFLGDDLVRDGDWEAWFPDREIVNFGMRDDTTDDLIARKDAVIEGRPSSIVLMIGTNDLSRKRSVEHLVRNVQYLMVSLRKELPGTRLLLHSILPRERERADQVMDANRHLRQFCPSLNAQYLDLWPALSLPDGSLNPDLGADSVHLNDDGYRLWREELEPALERLEDSPPMSRPISIVRGATEVGRAV